MTADEESVTSYLKVVLYTRRLLSSPCSGTRVNGVDFFFFFAYTKGSGTLRITYAGFLFLWVRIVC